MRIAVVGSRGWIEIHRIHEYLDRLPDDTEIVSGGATGPDTAAAQYAQQHGLRCKVFLPDWKTHGKSAGMIRNGQIIAYTEAVIAFWDGKSSGTKNTIDRALAAAHIRQIVVIKEHAT